jgi:hypothetical protein
MLWSIEISLALPEIEPQLYQTVEETEKRCKGVMECQHDTTIVLLVNEKTEFSHSE